MDSDELDPADFKIPFYALILIFLLCWTPSVFADPLYQARDGDAVITLYSDKCALSEVTNLARKATWIEKGKTYQGCWGAKAGIVIFYFSDKTVGIAPAEVFEKVQGA